MAADIIYSKQNPLIKHVQKLQESRGRKANDQFLIEGARELSYAIKNDFPIEHLLTCEPLFLSYEAADVVSKLTRAGVPVTEVRRDLFEAIAYRENPDGILAIAKPFKKTFEDLEKHDKAPLFVLVEGMEKPGNLGAIIRTAEAVGCDGLVLTESVIDIYNPNVIRASQGLVFSLPIIETSNIEAAAYFKKNGISLFATTPQAESPHWGRDYVQPSAFLIGSEKDGLSEFWLKDKSIQPIMIPQLGQADSLNAGIATAVVLFEALRQRTSLSSKS